MFIALERGCTLNCSVVGCVGLRFLGVFVYCMCLGFADVLFVWLEWFVAYLTLVSWL